MQDDVGAVSRSLSGITHLTGLGVRPDANRVVSTPPRDGEGIVGADGQVVGLIPLIIPRRGSGSAIQTHKDNVVVAVGYFGGIEVLRYLGHQLRPRTL